jgi:broad specificity phosphatase PhoE
MPIYAVRHQESQGNLEEIIQNRDYDFGLTKRGIEESKDLAKRLYDRLRKKDLGEIRSSPSKRAAQTAEIIAERFRIPLVYDPALVEFDPGILSGPKKDILPRYQRYLDIWNARGDLDGIPLAETGDALQARAIYFLDRYFMAERDMSDIIVSHAGFLRSLVNTSSGHLRSTPIGHEYSLIHEIENPSIGMDIRRLELAKASDAYKITTKDQTYVMKRIKDVSPEEMKFQKDVSAHVARSGALLSEVLFWGMHQDYAVQVLRYYEGNHIYDALSNMQRKNLFANAYDLGNRLTDATVSIGNGYGPTLKKKIESCMSRLDDSPLKAMGKKMINNQRYIYLVSDMPQVIVHYDFHRSNLVFTDNDEVRILDLGSMVYAPKQFLPASLFMSAFMLLDNNKADTDSLIDSWPCKLDKEDIVLLMQARAFIGGAFFQKKISDGKYNKEDHALYHRYVDTMGKISTLGEMH